MINQIDIERFGSFSNFEWKKSIRDHGNNVENFKRLNILYGRNYSGKTTLSRIFRSMQVGALPWNYEGAKFIAREQGKEFGVTALQSHGHEIRVYNKDFVAENLSVLVDHRNGQIKTFAIVGSENNRIVDELAQVNLELGSAEEKRGVRFETHKATISADSVRLKYSRERDAIDDKLRKHANEKIKKNRLIGQANYNIEHIKADIAFLKKEGIAQLDESEKSNMTELLKQEPLTKIDSLPAFPSNLASLRLQSEVLLSKVVAPTVALEDLLVNSDLQAWVKEGVRHHKGIAPQGCRSATVRRTIDQHWRATRTSVNAHRSDNQQMRHGNA